MLAKWLKSRTANALNQKSFCYFCVTLKFPVSQVVSRPADLPPGPVDLVLAAMEDQEMWSQERHQPWHRAATAWATACPAPVLALDPPPHPPPFPVRKPRKRPLPLYACDVHILYYLKE